MKFEYTGVFNFEGAIRGMRNPLESWKKSDSHLCQEIKCEDCTSEGRYCGKGNFIIGKNDLELMQKLIRAGSEHRKFMRQIFVSVDITAPLYFYKELDTYKVGTVANSTSTMHKLASTPITIDCFEMDDFEGDLPMINCNKVWSAFLDYLEALRLNYLETKDKRYWKELIRLLPKSWLQTRTVTMNYENILNMVHQRRNHKLTEWSVDFIDWTRSLPYAQELIFIDEVKNEKV